MLRIRPSVLLLTLGILLTSTLVRTARADELPPTVLVLDQAGPGLVAYANMTAHLRRMLGRHTDVSVSVYAESLDLSRFNSSEYRKAQSDFLREKYRDIQIGLIVALGTRALEFGLSLAADNWPGLPIIFAAVPEGAIDIAGLPSNVTGHTIRASLHDQLRVAQGIVPGLRRIALVGDPLEKQTFRFHQAKELGQIRSTVEIIDLTGLPFTEVAERVAHLPDDSAIIYTTINIDGDGKAFLPSDALAQLAEAANRPVIVDVEVQVGLGAIGGFVVMTRQIGEQAGLLTARLLNGESPSSIPVSANDAVKPVFDWRQMQRWGVAEGRLPSGSEIRFRVPTLWDQYSWYIILIGIAMLLQTASIIGLMHEDRHRRRAETDNQTLLSRIGYLNRVAAAGELTASIAHEVRQPLAAIAASGAAGLNWLKGTSPNISEAQATLHRIVNEVHRADDVIKNVRAMVRNEVPPRTEVDVNECIKQTLVLASRRIAAEGVRLKVIYADPPPIVLCNHVQLQQVLLNLIMNALEAMEPLPKNARRLSITSAVRNDADAIILVEDDGPGIPADRIDNIFDPFVTSKAEGMGLGLAICKSIVQAYGGTISARRRAETGMTFEVVLPIHGEAL